jgi:hypothetical protein
MWRTVHTGRVSSMDDITVQLNSVTPSKPAGCRTASPYVFYTTYKTVKHSGNKSISHVWRKIQRGSCKPHLVTKAETAWSNCIQKVLCVSYTTSLIWTWLDMGANLLKVAYEMVIHPNRTVRILRDCCFWTSNHIVTQWVQTLTVKQVKSCIPR